MKDIYEKAGLFYVGKDVDKDTQQPTDVLTLLKNKNFTTHAAIIGMTGSGKTGLGIGLIEEAAIDNIPAIIIDPKGDMGNLLLTDPTFSPKSFEPWVKNEADSKNVDALEYATKISKVWKDGIESWGQDSSRVEKFAKVEKNIYTPGSLSGIPINVVSSFEAPSQEIMQDSDIYASYIKSTANSLLSLIGLSSQGIDSKEYILIAQLLSNAWLNQESITLHTLVGQIIEPPFKHIGVLPLDSFYTPEDRFKLATKFNSLLASPDFALWLQGDSLDIQKLLYDENGKAKISIFSISHLNDEQRMFFVTLLLNQYISWMRRQSGTSTLKALLYMDEIYGFFPPSKNPPSKEPMLLLLKQARAFGLGVVLSTQNPVDLDYKGLSNIGTWFIGRLQTSQDIQRVIDGLGTKVGSSYSKKDIKNLLSNLEKRVFFLKSAHLDDIRLFSTRWVLSYLKGPLSKMEISTLMASKKQKYISRDTSSSKKVAKTFKEYQSLDDSIPQYFEPNIMDSATYIPTISTVAEVHFYNQTKGIDKTVSYDISLALDSDMDSLDWSEYIENQTDFTRYPKQPPKDATFEELPSFILEDKRLKSSQKSCIDYLYHNSKLTLYKCKSLKVESKPDEEKADFLVRVQDVANDKKEEELEKLKARYKKRLDTLEDRLQRAQERVEKEKSDSTSSMLEAGISILGALFGRTTPTKLGRAVSKSSKILKERGDLSRAEQRVAEIQSDIEDLEYELEDKIDELNQKYDIDNLEISEYFIKPKKTNIEIKECAVVWRVAI